MDPAVRKFIQRYTVDTVGVECISQLHKMLPLDELELDAWIAEALAVNESWEFTFLVIGAQTSKRFVDARHLVKGAGLLAQHGAMNETVRKMQQDATPDYLMQPVREQTLDQANEAWALFFIAVWCNQRRNGIFPEDLAPLARSHMTARSLTDQAAFYLLGSAVATNDDVLLDLLRQFYKQFPEGDSVWPGRLNRAKDVSRKLLDRAISGSELMPHPPYKPRHSVAPRWNGR